MIKGRNSCSHSLFHKPSCRHDNHESSIDTTCKAVIQEQETEPLTIFDSKPNTKSAPKKDKLSVQRNIFTLIPKISPSLHHINLHHNHFCNNYKYNYYSSNYLSTFFTLLLLFTLTHITFVSAKSQEGSFEMENDDSYRRPQQVKTHYNFLYKYIRSPYARKFYIYTDTHVSSNGGNNNGDKRMLGGGEMASLDRSNRHINDSDVMLYSDLLSSSQSPTALMYLSQSEKSNPEDSDGNTNMNNRTKYGKF